MHHFRHYRIAILASWQRNRRTHRQWYRRHHSIRPHRCRYRRCHGYRYRQHRNLSHQRYRGGRHMSSSPPCHPRQQKNNRTVATTEQQQSSNIIERGVSMYQRQSGSHETLSSTDSPLLFRFWWMEVGANLEGKSIDLNRMASAWRSPKQMIRNICRRKKCQKLTFFS